MGAVGFDWDILVLVLVVSLVVLHDCEARTEEEDRNGDDDDALADVLIIDPPPLCFSLVSSNSGSSSIG